MKIAKSTIKTEDKFNLAVLNYIPDEKPKGKIIMNHGLSVPKEGPKNILVNLANALCDQGYYVVSYDFRGHGESAGDNTDATLEGFIKDLDAIMKSEAGDLPISLFGFSFGAATCLVYTKQYNIDVNTMVFWSPLLEGEEASFYNENSLIGQATLENLNNGENFIYLKNNNFKLNKKFLEEIKVYKPYQFIKPDNNILVLQSSNDQMIDINYQRKYKNLFKEYKELEAVHALLEQEGTAIAETIKWFNQYN